METPQHQVRLVCTIGREGRAFEKDMNLPFQPQLKMSLELCVANYEDLLETVVEDLRWDEKKKILYVYIRELGNDQIWRAVATDPSWSQV